MSLTPLRDALSLNPPRGRGRRLSAGVFACGGHVEKNGWPPVAKDDPKSPEWRPYIFVRDQWHCRICGDRFQYSEAVRKHVAHAHHENMPPSMYEYFRGAVWHRKKIP